MGELAEDRVYDERAGKRTVYAATGTGVAAVEVSGDRVGRFRLDRRCGARDLASGAGWLAVATGEDVLALDLQADEQRYVETGFGPAVAVGFDEDDLLAAGPDGRIGRVVHVAEDPTEWLDVAAVDGAVRAIDGPLVGASDGVYQLTPDAIVDVGLDDVRDVAGRAAALAATGDGLYRLGNGWLREAGGAFDVVAADPEDGERAHAATGERVYEYGADGGWTAREVPAGPVVDFAYGERTYALAADGTFLVDRGDGWARRSLGLADAAALAVGPA